MFGVETRATRPARWTQLYAVALGKEDTCPFRLYLFEAYLREIEATAYLGKRKFARGGT